MPVTVRPSRHAPRAIDEYSTRHTDRLSRFCDACPKEHERCRALLQSSYDACPDASIVFGSPNGFFLGALMAYNEHHHLVLRPEDIWFAILSQLSFYIGAHAEELRGQFVSHEGRKEMTVVSADALTMTDIGDMALVLAKALSGHMKDPDLYDWIMPEFSTTTQTDRVVASIIMAGAMREYFDHKFSFMCGIPSITLQGVRDDWEKLERRLGRIAELGDEPRNFGALLKPILSRMVRTFDDPLDDDIVDFWAKIVHESGGSGVHYLSGWITAFCFWDANGMRMFQEQPTGDVEINGKDVRRPGCVLDGVLYHRFDSGKVPIGWASAPLKVVDGGRVFKAAMVAGSMALEATASGDRLGDGQRHVHDHVDIDGDGRRVIVSARVDDGCVPEDAGRNQPLRPGSGPDTLQPVAGWWMYEVAETVEDGDDFWLTETESEWVPTGLAARIRELRVSPRPTPAACSPKGSGRACASEANGPSWARGSWQLSGMRWERNRRLAGPDDESLSEGSDPFPTEL